VPREFSSYGSRRGNDSVMLRAMFAHSRLDNRLTSKPGSHTVHVPSNSVVRDCFPFFMSVLDFLIFVLKISVSFFALYEPWHCNNRPVSFSAQMPYKTIEPMLCFHFLFHVIESLGIPVHVQFCYVRFSSFDANLSDWLPGLEDHLCSNLLCKLGHETLT